MLKHLRGYTDSLYMNLGKLEEASARAVWGRT